jgi:parvulin-like peptidyl-prolyl isomerase
VGRDPKFIGEALMLKPGEISKPFDGARGYYIVKLISRTPFDTTRYASEHNTLRDQILQEKKSRFMNEWMTALRDKADIVDNRQKFYR